MKKEIIFFDGDGTLWYPKVTKYTEKPHWVYSKYNGADDVHQHLMMIPAVTSTLRKLRKKGIITVVLSTHPHPPKEANDLINRKIQHFKLSNLFDEVHATREYHESKGEFIIKILHERGIAKSKALMVGDHYHWDYKPARDVGVDALLIQSAYMKQEIYSRQIKHTIKKLSDVLKYI